MNRFYTSRLLWYISVIMLSALTFWGWSTPSITNVIAKEEIVTFDEYLNEQYDFSEKSTSIITDLSEKVEPEVIVTDNSEEVIIPEDPLLEKSETSLLEVDEVKTLSNDILITKERDSVSEPGANNIVDASSKQQVSNEVTNQQVIEVFSFDELRDAILNAGIEPTLIRIMESFDLTSKLTIRADQQITLTANNNQQAMEEWVPIEQPADYADEGEARQREIIELARQRGEEAIEMVSESNAPLPSRNNGDIILRRASDFLADSLFSVLGKLILGTEDSALYLDGNNEVTTSMSSKGIFFDVGSNAFLEMKNATLMNAKNNRGYSAPIYLRKDASFEMNGGRITNNYVRDTSLATRPTSAGAVYVNPGANFIMNNGIMDNNLSQTGAIYVGDFFGNTTNFAYTTINGGYIVENTANYLGGALVGFPASVVYIKDGIFAANNGGTGGAFSFSDQFIHSFSNSLNNNYVNTYKDYEEWIKKNLSEAHFSGGLVYKNRASSSGGGLYIDTNHVHLTKTLLLDNHANMFGGGFYVSYPPRIQTLEKLLVTENRATGSWIQAGYGGGNGGGLWNCPTGYVHIGDGHSVYVFNNEARYSGKDLSFTRRTLSFILNKERIQEQFYSHVSPITLEKNIIKYLEDGNSNSSIPENISYTALMMHLEAVYYQALIEEAWSVAQTFILGNTANNGGGIGSNANLETPVDEGDYDLLVEKEWDEQIGEPDLGTQILVDIFIVPLDATAEDVRFYYGDRPDYYKYGEIRLNRLNEWRALFSESSYAKYDHLPATILDHGLPFSADELRALGMKYLVIERENGYISRVKEIPVKADETVTAGQVVIERRFSTDLPGYESDAMQQDAKLLLYYQNSNGIVRLIDQQILNEDSQWKATFVHPLLLTNPRVEYYGKDRIFTDYNESWSKFRGYNVDNAEYAFILKENTDGTMILQVPYLWIQAWDKQERRSGFIATPIEEEVTVNIPGQEIHTFNIHNSLPGRIDVTKTWEEAEGVTHPESVIIYLLRNGKKIIRELDDEGNPIYESLILNKDNDWKGSFDNLDQAALALGEYSLSEAPVQGYRSEIEITGNSVPVEFIIGYANSYKTVDGLNISTSGQLIGYLGDISLNLYVDGNLQETQKFTVTEEKHPFIEGVTYYEWNKSAHFGLAEQIRLLLNGADLYVTGYDLVQNEPGLTSYDFYIQRNELGMYTLYVPRLYIDGAFYDVFTVFSHEDEEKQTPLSVIKGIETEYEAHNVHNIYNLTDVEVEKIWVNGPEEKPTITIELLRNGEVIDTIQLANGETRYQWRDLPRTDEAGNAYVYTVREEAVEGYTSSLIGDASQGFVITNTATPPEEPEIPEEPEKPEEPEDTPPTPPVTPPSTPLLPQTGEIHREVSSEWIWVLGFWMTVSLLCVSRHSYENE